MKIFIVLIFLVSPFFSSVFAVPIINDSFETDEAALSPSQITGWERIHTIDLISPGGTTYQNLFNSGLDMSASPGGGQFIMGQNAQGEGIKQTINGLEVGATYNVSFYQANAGLRDYRVYPDQVGGGLWEVSLGQSSQLSNMMFFEGWGEQSWELISLNFVAVGESEILSFVAAGYDSVNVGRLALDHVVITKVALPSSLWLSLWGGFVIIRKNWVKR